MRFFYSLLIALLLCLSSNSQPFWYRFSGATGPDESLDLAVDTSGNIINVGYFSNSIALGSTTLSANGVTDIFISKSNATGDYIWSRNFGGSGDDRATSVVVDDSLNIYITGYFNGNCQFGSFLLTAQGLQDAFVTKLDKNGTVLWAKSAVGTSNELGNAISIDANHNVFITGQFIGTTAFDATTTITSQIDPTTSAPSTDIFVAKYSSSGVFSWVRAGKAKFTDRGITLANATNGDVYVSGQFSDTITFQTSHPNITSNSIFLVCFDTNGNEKWFNRISGGISIIRDMCIDNAGFFYLTGDCSSSTFFFGTTLYTVGGSYTYYAFRAKYNSQGNPVWVKGDGSNNQLKSGAICVKNNSLFVTGAFKCNLSAYSQFYGQGLFLSSGDFDAFVSKYDTSGNFGWSRQYGGNGEVETNSISYSNSRLIYGGSFTKRFIYPYSQNYIFPSLDSVILSGGSTAYKCGDALSGRFVKGVSTGSKDIFFGDGVDLSRSYYFFNQIDTNCLYPIIAGAINNSLLDNDFGSDTIRSCGPTKLYAATNTSSTADDDTLETPGPTFSYLWSTGETTKKISINASGTYSVLIQSAENCYSSRDTVYVEILPLPPVPLLSDSKGINTNAFATQTVRLCAPDSLSFTSPATSLYAFSWSSLTTTSTNPIFNVVSSIADSFNVTLTIIDSNNCSRTNSIYLVIDTALTQLAPAFVDVDTISLCTPLAQTLSIYDSIFDPTQLLTCYIENAKFEWTSIPTLNFSLDCNYGQTAYFLPDTISQNYQITCKITRSSFCSPPDTFLLTTNLYIEIYPDSTGPPPPIVASDSVLCPGDSIFLSSSGLKNYNWEGPNGFSSNDSSITVFSTGTYTLSVIDTNQFGCEITAINSVVIAPPTPPLIDISTVSPILCPGDSVLLVCYSTGSYQWFGPFGPINTNNDSIYVTTPGLYFCSLTASGCLTSSASVEVEVYSSPELTVNPSFNICQNSTVELIVSANPGSIIQWNSPLSGSSITQSVSTAGIYSCSILSCGVLTNDTVTLLNSTFNATINSPATTFCEGDSILLTPASTAVINTWFPANINTANFYATQPGNYYVVSVDIDGCEDTSNVITITSISAPDSVSISGTETVCEGDTIVLRSDSTTNLIYQWETPSGMLVNDSILLITQAALSDNGNYYLRLSDGVCFGKKSTINVMVNALPNDVEITANNPICLGTKLTLSVPFEVNQLYNWTTPNLISIDSTVLTIDKFMETDIGIYTVTIDNANCSLRNAIEIEGINCSDDQVNVFTPNGDGINDEFFISSDGVSLQTFKVFNRWGSIVYENNTTISWDGNDKNGDPLPEGGYFYVLDFIPLTSTILLAQKGVIQLMR